MGYIVLIARVVVGGLFVYAAVTKIPDPAGFAESIRNYGILPVELSNLAGIILPWIEVLAGFGLIVGVWTRASALITTCLLFVFALAVTYAYWIGLDISCGCFGPGPDSSGRIDLLTVFREWGLTILSLLILLYDKGRFTLEAYFKDSTGNTKALGSV